MIATGLTSGVLGKAFQQVTAEFFAMVDNLAALQATEWPAT